MNIEAVQAGERGFEATEGGTANAVGEGSPTFERLGQSLYWKGGKIVARVRINGKQTWRSTGTDNPADARKWLKQWRKEEFMQKAGIEPEGVVLHRKRVTVGELIDEYVSAGMPTRKMRCKSEATLKNERYFLSPTRAYFGQKQAASVTLADCDSYRDWRLAGGYVSTFRLQGGQPRTLRTSGGNRTVDLELTILSNVFNLAVRRNRVKANPLAGRGRYSHAADVRHCREVAPTPESLQKMTEWLRGRNEHGVADLVSFLAYSGLRIGEALALTWDSVNRQEQLVQVKREKRGIMPWVPILREMETLLDQMLARATGSLLFPSPFEPSVARDPSAVRHRIKAACKALKIGHVTPHGLRSYFVTQARQSGLTDAEIAMLIGDKTGPAIIAHTYGDVRPEHLLAQARKIQLSAAEPTPPTVRASSIESSITLQVVSPGSSGVLGATETADAAAVQPATPVDLEQRATV